MSEETKSDDLLEHDAEHIEHMREHVRVYISVFVALAVLTIITVAIARLHFSPPLAIAIALLVACIKGSLVACYFMHLIGERKLIYWVLILTAIFFVTIFVLPMGQYLDPGVNTHTP